MSIDLEQARRVETLLLYRETEEQGLEILAALAERDLPAWVASVARTWRLYDPTYKPGPRLAARITAACTLFNVESYARGLRLTDWTPEELSAYHTISARAGRLRLLWPDEAELLAGLAPATAPYLRSCVRHGWRPGVLTQAIVGALCLPVLP